jgi:hypothetical protein
MIANGQTKSRRLAGFPDSHQLRRSVTGFPAGSLSLPSGIPLLLTGLLAGTLILLTRIPVLIRHL